MVPLPKSSLSKIRSAVDRLFAKARQLLLGREPGAKTILVSSDKTLGDMYEASAQHAGGHPSDHTAATFREITKSYLDAAQARARAQVVKDVDSTIREVEARGETPDPGGVIGAKLAETLGTITRDVQRIAETEATAVRNVGVIEGITRNSVLAGEDDPVIFFRVVRDPPWPCDECKRIHLLPDQITPRVYKLSEVKMGYHKKGEDQPCMSGLHPNCQCLPAACPRGYGFSAGSLVFKSLDWDEFAHQRGQE